MRKPPTGEPCAGEPHARFGGRGRRKPFPTPIVELSADFFIEFPRQDMSMRITIALRLLGTIMILATVWSVPAVAAQTDAWKADWEKTLQRKKGGSARFIRQRRF